MDRAFFHNFRGISSDNLFRTAKLPHGDGRWGIQWARKCLPICRRWSISCCTACFYPPPVGRRVLLSPPAEGGGGAGVLTRPRERFSFLLQGAASWTRRFESPRRNAVGATHAVALNFPLGAVRFLIIGKKTGPALKIKRGPYKTKCARERKSAMSQEAKRSFAQSSLACFSFKKSRSAFEGLGPGGVLGHLLVTGGLALAVGQDVDLHLGLGAGGADDEAGAVGHLVP